MNINTLYDKDFQMSENFIYYYSKSLKALSIQRLALSLFLHYFAHTGIISRRTRYFYEVYAGWLRTQINLLIK